MSTDPRRVGYYVHHVGSGHLHRATALAAELGGRGLEVTGLSSLPRPARWDGPWVELPRDDDPPPAPGADPGAHGRLHWVPLRHAGLRQRMARLSTWLSEAAPLAVVSDVSQEVTLLVRLHGVPVVSVVQPGRRDDPAHTVGLGASSAIVAFWPPMAASPVAMSPELTARLRPLGGLSRFPPAPVRARTAPVGGSGRGLVLAGTGGGADRLRAVGERLRDEMPAWSWTVLAPGSWDDDPVARITGADVVVTHGGQNALADVAAARVPAVVVAQPRPHEEQTTMAGALAGARWPVVVPPVEADVDWADLVRRAAALDGAGWAAWVDGAAAARFADIVEEVAS